MKSLYLVGLLLLMACSSQELSALKSENESLKAQLTEAVETAKVAQTEAQRAQEMAQAQVVLADEKIADLEEQLKACK